MGRTAESCSYYLHSGIFAMLYNCLWKCFWKVQLVPKRTAVLQRIVVIIVLCNTLQSVLADCFELNSKSWFYFLRLKCHTARLPKTSFLIFIYMVPKIFISYSISSCSCKMRLGSWPQEIRLFKEYRHRICWNSSSLIR